MSPNFEIFYTEKMDNNHQSLICEAFNKDANNKKGLKGDLKSFSFSCLDQNKNFIAGVSGVSFWGAFYITALFVDEKSKLWYIANGKG